VEWSSANSTSTNAIVPAGITTYTIMGLAVEVDYTVTVFALNSMGESSGTTATQRTSESSNEKKLVLHFAYCKKHANLSIVWT